jgi:hypothetical protein
VKSDRWKASTGKMPKLEWSEPDWRCARYLTSTFRLVTPPRADFKKTAISPRIVSGFR